MSDVSHPVVADHSAAEHAAPIENGVPMTAPQQPELHRACAEGNVDDLRAALSRGEALETIDITTGCTPIVLAIQNGHVDIVRELLNAGAIVPPPGLTNDPIMLSVLYPQPIYGMPPPPFLGAGMGVPPHFYPQPGFYPDAQGQQRPMFGMRPDGSSPLGGPGPNGIPGQPGAPGIAANGAPSPSNLPPADVAKTIPCRNFPNCKYGAACVFYHPTRPTAAAPGGPGVGAAGVPAFYSQFAPGPEGFVPYQNGGAPFYPPEFSVPEGQQVGESSDAVNGSAPGPVPVPINGHVPSALTPAFIPGGQPIPAPSGDNYLSSPPTVPGQFGLSPMSPQLMASPSAHLPSDFFATSPPTLPGPFGVANGFAPRRQSFGQFAGKPFNPAGPNVGGGPSGHAKKPSFSGPSGAKPWGPTGRPSTSHLGTWKDGVPPPCAFFREGKCRNGEFCKFPHLDAEGNDCRHPDVIRGVIPPAPTRPRQVRMMGGPNGHFDPALRQQQFVNKTVAASAALAAGIPTAPLAKVPTEDAIPATIPESAAPVEAETDKAAEAAAPTIPEPAPAAATSATTTPTTVSTSTLPAKPVSFSPIPPIVRSASQPGVARVHASGHASRSHSPAGSFASQQHVANGHAHFAHGMPNGNGPRRNGSAQRFPNGNAGAGMNVSRSSSAGPDRRTTPNGHANANGQAGQNHANANGHHNHHRAGTNSSSGTNAASTPAPAQRIPGAADFPALANGGVGAGPALGAATGTVTPNGNGSSTAATNTPSSERREPNWGSMAGGKTAAQVLSEPAPPRPVVVKPATAEATDAATVTMDSDTEADTVIVSKAPSPAPPAESAKPAAPTPAAAAPATTAASTPVAKSPASTPAQRPVSFASAAAATAAAAVIAPVETAPVALKA